MIHMYSVLRNVANLSTITPNFHVYSCMVIRKLSNSTSNSFKCNNLQYQDDGPIKFTKSGAYNLNPIMANQRRRDETPWFQGPIVMLSTASLLIYFTMLRYFLKPAHLIVFNNY